MKANQDGRWRQCFGKPLDPLDDLSVNRSATVDKTR